MESTGQRKYIYNFQDIFFFKIKKKKNVFMLKNKFFHLLQTNLNNSRFDKDFRKHF